MGTNQSNCYHDYPKLEENMVSTVRCHHIRNDDNSNAFLYILLSTILTEVDHRQMLSCMEVRSKKKKKHISKRSNSRNIGTTKRCNIAASLFCNRSDSPYGISASLKTQLNWNWFLPFILNKLYSLLLRLFPTEGRFYNLQMQISQSYFTFC